MGDLRITRPDGTVWDLGEVEQKVQQDLPSLPPCLNCGAPLRFEYRERGDDPPTFVDHGNGSSTYTIRWHPAGVCDWCGLVAWLHSADEVPPPGADWIDTRSP